MATRRRLPTYSWRLGVIFCHLLSFSYARAAPRLCLSACRRTFAAVSCRADLYSHLPAIQKPLPAAFVMLLSCSCKRKNRRRAHSRFSSWTHGTSSRARLLEVISCHLPAGRFFLHLLCPICLSSSPPPLRPPRLLSPLASRMLLARPPSLVQPPARKAGEPEHRKHGKRVMSVHLSALFFAVSMSMVSGAGGGAAKNGGGSQEGGRRAQGMSSRRLRARAPCLPCALGAAARHRCSRARHRLPRAHRLPWWRTRWGMMYVIFLHAVSSSPPRHLQHGDVYLLYPRRAPPPPMNMVISFLSFCHLLSSHKRARARSAACWRGRPVGARRHVGGGAAPAPPALSPWRAPSCSSAWDPPSL